MKDIKSFLIGFLSCVCLMLFMGQSKQPNDDIGRYQGFVNEYAHYLIDTTNGQLYRLETYDNENSKRLPRYKMSWSVFESAKLND